MAKKEKKPTKSATGASKKETTVRVIKDTGAEKKAPRVLKAKKIDADDEIVGAKEAGGIFAIGRYFKGSWYELRQVRWPNRKATWKMTLAVILYTGAFFGFIVILDAIFTLVFNRLLGY